MILFLKGFFTKYKNIIFNIFLLFMLSYNIFYNRVFGVIVVSFILLIQLGKKHKKIKKYIDQYEEDKAIKQYHLAKDFSLFNYVFSFSQLFLFFLFFIFFLLSIFGYMPSLLSEEILSENPLSLAYRFVQFLLYYMIFFMVLIIIKVLIEIYIIFFKNFVTTQKAISTGVTILGGLGSIAAGSIFLGNSPVYCGPIQEWIQVNTPLAQGIIVSGLRYGYNEALKFELSPDDYSKMKEKIINDRREFDTSLVYQYIKDNPELVKKYPALQSKNFLINSIAKVSGLWNPALDLSAHELASQNHNLITEVEELRNELEIAKEKEILVKELLAENARIKAGLSKLLEDSLPKDMDIILKNKIKEDILHNLGHKDKYFNSIDLESEKLSTKK